jgi:phage I-like protein
MSEYDRPLEALAFTAATLDEGLKTVRLTPDGEVKSANGTFIMDNEAARLIIEAFEQHGTALPIDYEHQTLGGEYASPDGRAPAAGWIEKLFYEQGRGLQALVRWNDRTRESLRSGEYRYISPVLQVRTDDRRAAALHSAALTNKPAIPRMEKLAASARYTENMTMPNQEDTKGGDPTALIAEIKAFLGIKTDSSEVVAVLRAIRDWAETYSKSKDEDKEVASSVRTQLGLSDDAGKDEIILAMSLHADSGRRAEVARDVDDRIDILCKSNVLNPNDHPQIEAARSLAIESPERFEALIGRMKPFVPPGRTTPPPGPGVGGKSRHATIVNAVREFGADESVGKMTTLQAFVDLRLKESGLGKSSTEELQEYTV